MIKPASSCVAIDWGSTHLRAKLVIDGHVVETANSSDGIRFCPERNFEEILGNLVRPWLRERTERPLYLSGMIGSRDGWHEVPYVTAPCRVAEVAAGMMTIESGSLGKVHLLPGVRWIDPDTDTIEVMRGEEVEVLGLIEALPRDPIVIILPGTHSKWVDCRDGRIESFRTWLTGETYDRFHRESLISGSAVEADPQSDAFAHGVACSGTPGGLLHHLFQIRTRRLSGLLEPDGIGSFLSGLLAGHEVREAIHLHGGNPLYLYGKSPAAIATATAMRILGISHEPLHQDAHLDGILRIASSLA